MINVLGDILPQIKNELSKELIMELDLNELAQKLYPIFKEMDKRNPKTIMENHKRKLLNSIKER